MLPSQKKKLRAERAAMQPQYDPNDPDAIVPVQEEMIEAAPGQQLVTRPPRIFEEILHPRAVVWVFFMATRNCRLTRTHFHPSRLSTLLGS